MNSEHLLCTPRSQGRFCAASASPMYGEPFELGGRFYLGEL